MRPQATFWRSDVEKRAGTRPQDSRCADSTMAVPAMPCNWQEKEGTYIRLPKRRWVEAKWDTRLEATTNSGSPGAGFGVVGSDVALGRRGTYARRRARPSLNGLPPATACRNFTPCNYPTRPGKRSSSRIAATTQIRFSRSLTSWTFCPTCSGASQ